MTNARDETLANDLHDVVTHRAAWRSALIECRERSKSFTDDADESYWEHELKAFDRTFDKLATLLRTAPPATDTGMRQALEDETAWLVELRGSAPSWWSLNDEGDGPGWTTHADDAVRFARKQDAQAYIDEVGWTGAFPSEHMWCSPRAALSRPPQVADTREGEAHRVTIKTAGKFRIVGDDEDTTGAVVLFPDGPPTFPISVIWDREVMTLSRALASGADEKGGEK